VYVLQSFAAERRLKLLFEGLHDARGATTLSHQLRVSDRMAGTAALLDRAGARWSTALAHAVGRTALQHSPMRIEKIATAMPRAADHPGMLVSWVLG
jgi:hypothetical protein